MVETRRDKRRRETVEEIKALAWRQFEQGLGEINLHEIARQMGITPPAIYRYFPSRQALTVSLMEDSLRDYQRALEKARDSLPDSDPAGRLQAVALAWRRWAVTHPAAFGLFTRRNLPGYAPEQEPLAAIDKGLRRIFIDLLESAWQSGVISVSPVLAQVAAPYHGHLEKAQIRFKTRLPPETLLAGIHLWGMIHGLISTEISGRFDRLLENPGAIFEAQVQVGLRLLGLEAR